MGFKDLFHKNQQEKRIPTTQDQLAIDYIKGGIFKLKKGGYRLLVELPSVNIDLMEMSEKEIVLEQYRQILNAIDFPFQILQQSRLIDVSEYQSTLKAQMGKLNNLLLKKQLEYYYDFVDELIRERSILTKKFYIVCAFDDEKENKNRTLLNDKKKAKKKKGKKVKMDEQALAEEAFLLEEKQFEKAKKVLYQRGGMIDRLFRRFEINPKILNDQDVLELFYTSYNKDRSIVQSLRTKDLEDYTTLHVRTKRKRGGESHE